MTAQDFWHVSDPAVVAGSKEYQDVVAWLAKHGSPLAPTLVKTVTNNIPTVKAIWGDNLHESFVADLIHEPSTVLSELRRRKIATIPAGDPDPAPYPDVVPEKQTKYPDPHEPLPPAVGPPHAKKEGWWVLAEGTSAAPEGAKIKGPDGRMYVSVAAISPFGKEFHYELAEEEADAPAAPAPQAPIVARVPEFEQPTLDLGAILALLAKKVTPEQFMAVLALLAPKTVTPAPVIEPTVKFLKEDGTAFPNGAMFVDHKVARKGKTVITAPIGCHISRITYTNGRPNMASPQGQFPVDANGNAVLDGVQFNYPEYGVYSKEGIHYFWGPKSGTDWKPFGELFETSMFNADAPVQIVTGPPRT